MPGDEVSRDARYAFRFEKFEFSLAADNLTNRKSYSLGFSCLAGSVYPDPGRVLKAAVKYSF